jgi:glutamine phosphoribosylpyrophosphate amidotransferase
LREAIGERQNAYCSSCYTGVYPVPFPQDEKAYLQLALKAVD